jgi:hypothetical protein
MGWIKRTILFFAKATIIGFIVVVLYTWLTGGGLSDLTTMHGMLDFVLLCAFLGSLLLWFWGRLGSRSNKQQAVSTDNTVDVTNIKKPKKKSILSSVAQAAAAQAAYNVVSNPVVVPLNGGTVHGANPKGIGQWEIHYSVPGDSRVHRSKYRRGTVGFTHGKYQFRITWPSAL